MVGLSYPLGWKYFTHTDTFREASRMEEGVEVFFVEDIPVAE